MKGLQSIEFSEMQMKELERESQRLGLTATELVEKMMRKHLNVASGRKELIKGQIIPFKEQIRPSKAPSTKD